MDANKMVSAYVKIRDARAALKAKFDEEDAALAAQLDVIENALLEVCKDTGAESIRTQHGTAFRSVKERFWAADWDEFKDFVREHDAVDLLERRIHQGNFKEWASQHPDVVAPVNVDRKYTITVRRSNK